MKNTFFNSGMAAVLLTFALILSNCASAPKNVTDDDDGLFKGMEAPRYPHLYATEDPFFFAASEIVNSSDGGIAVGPFIDKLRDVCNWGISRNAFCAYIGENISLMDVRGSRNSVRITDTFLFTQRPGNEKEQFIITRILLWYNREEGMRDRSGEDPDGLWFELKNFSLDRKNMKRVYISY